MTWTESESLEFKASFSKWKETVRSLCAFANAKGVPVELLESRGRSVSRNRLLASLRHRGEVEFHGSPKIGGYRAIFGTAERNIVKLEIL